MKIRYLFILILIFSAQIYLLNAFSSSILAAECNPGYKFSPSAGVDCQQIDCNNVPNAHYGSTGHCVCGSSGSIYENPDDPNHECTRSLEDKDCKGCVYACVHKAEECPNYETETKKEENDSKCVNYCKKFINKGGPLSEITEVSGTYPSCNCTADIYNDKGMLTSTIKFTEGDKKTTFTFDPTTGVLVRKDSISLTEEREKIRESLGFKYTEDEIDKKVDPEVVSKWFQDTTKEIKTSTSILTASFWTQHIMAILDHGYGNSAEFVDTYQYGRCGDSMLWLENKLSTEMGVQDKKQEAFLSITGENYGNITNHTAIMIRPKGIDNLTWAEAVNTLVASSNKSKGLNQNSIENIDERILDAKVIDPYFKSETTVRDFIKGWTVVRIS